MTSTGGRSAGLNEVPAVLRRAALVSACLLTVMAAIYVLIVLLVRLAPLTLAVLAALLLAALVSPVSSGLRRLRAPAWLAALSGVLILLATLAVPLAVIGNRTVDRFPDLEQKLHEGLGRVRRLLTDGSLPISDRQVDAAIDGLAEAARKVAPDPVGGASTAAQIIASTLTALVLLFFLLKDGADIWRWLLRLVPARLRDRVDQAARSGWETLLAYVRGTVLVALIDGLGIGAALLLIGVPLAMPLALLTFLAAFVPIVGATVAGAVAVLVAFVSNGLTAALLVLLAVIVVQQVEGNLLQPLIMGRALRLHPGVVILTVTAGTLLGGIAGAVIAVPVTAVGFRFVTTMHATRPELSKGGAEPVAGHRSCECGPEQPVRSRDPG